MTEQIINYQCERCKHIQTRQFSICPACGWNFIEGRSSRDDGGKSWFEKKEERNLLGY